VTMNDVEGDELWLFVKDCDDDAERVDVEDGEQVVF